jgi:hypothetical protein
VGDDVDETMLLLFAFVVLYSTWSVRVHAFCYRNDEC